MNSVLASKEIVVSTEGDRTTITLDRPHVGNALSPSLVESLDDAFTKAISDGARLVVFRGAGKHLCTGFDLGDLESCSDGDLLLRFVKIEQFLQKVYRSPVTTAAVGTGRIFGAGADLFAACDRRIGFPDAGFAFPGSGFGVVLGTRRLGLRIGHDAARRTLLEGKTIPVSRAAELGLVTDQCDDAGLSELLDEILRFATRLSSETVAALHSMTVARDDAADLAALVNSASTPGLKTRIADYRRSLAAERRGT